MERYYQRYLEQLSWSSAVFGFRTVYRRCCFTAWFFSSLFLMLCIGLGFFIGNKLDKKEDLLEWLDRLLPPGYHR